MKCIARNVFLFLILLVSLFSAVALASPPARYIVVLHERGDTPAAAAKAIAGQVGGQVGFIYEHALKGFSISVPEQAVAALQRNPHVKYIVSDDLRYASEQTAPTGIQRILAPGNANIGIDGSDDERIDVDVAIIDTGIDFQHPDLNVAGGVNCVSDNLSSSPSCVSGGDDDTQHGTHVAGIVGALDNDVGTVGVAPGARLWAVKVLDANGRGYSSWIIAGIDWVAANAATIEVANMSLGGSGYSQAEYDAIQGAVNRGVAFAVAAGNKSEDALNYSPAAFNNVLTVSALADFDGIPGGLGRPTCSFDQDDSLANFSNWGAAVDLVAPGVCIFSTYPLEKGGYGMNSGTSMACPHVTGALALLASVNNPESAIDVFNLYGQVKSAGNDNWRDDSGDGVKEPLLDVGIFSAIRIPVAAINLPPVVNITRPTDSATFVSGATIDFSGTASDPEDGDLTPGLTWTSGVDGLIGSGGAISAVLSEGTHSITAAITDAGGLAGSAGVTITVVVGGREIALNVNAYKVKNVQKADLTWSGALATNVDVKRNSRNIPSTMTTPNDGSYTDSLAKNTASATYQVCEAATSTCSKAVTVSWR